MINYFLMNYLIPFVSCAICMYIGILIGKFRKNEVTKNEVTKKIRWKRPLNVDIRCRLRVIGWSKDSFTFESDEGDGYDIFPIYSEGEGPSLQPEHYEEWAEQLSYAAEWCREKAEVNRNLPYEKWMLAIGNILNDGKKVQK